MDAHPFYAHSTWSVLIVTSLVLMAAALVGFLIGRLTYRQIVDKSQVSTIQASVLGLLALMLGFTFGVASTRYDSRRILAVNEANALGTTFMRAQMLPKPYKTRISGMLRHYIDVRLKTVSAINNLATARELRKETEQLQREIWGQAVGAARQDSSPITALFVTSLNESIDLHASRIAEFLARVPSTIMWILISIAIAAVGLVGYGLGIIGQRSWLVMALVSVIIAAVMTMIVDLDRPEAGPTRVSQQSMVDLRNSLSGFEQANR